MNRTCFWIYGPGGSGKTTLAEAMVYRERSMLAFDAEEIRAALYPDLGYSGDDRKVNVSVLAKLAQTSVHAGSSCVVAAVTPYHELRDHARRTIELVGGRFVSVELYGRGRPLWPGTHFMTGGANLRFNTNELGPEFIAGEILGEPDPPRRTFIGRWQPFHRGHEKIIREALAEGPVAVGVRDTPQNFENPLPLRQRIRMIRDAFKGADVVVFACPDVHSIHIGREIGYEVHTEVPGISGTQMRDGL